MIRTQLTDNKFYFQGTLNEIKATSLFFMCKNIGYKVECDNNCNNHDKNKYSLQPDMLYTEYKKRFIDKYMIAKPKK